MDLNLHPDNQRKIGRFLARMVNAGIRLVVTTHSDLIIQELSNLVQLGEAGERGRELATELGYAENQLLRADQVGVTLCTRGTLEAIAVTGDGFSIPTMDDAIGDLDYLSQRIYGALHES
ncbi:MAG: hypothetical protein IV100_31635 [Myxococcales bacterium]|nr:hypothetical protein [Myxococcales bacterium]